MCYHPGNWSYKRPIGWYDQLVPPASTLVSRPRFPTKVVLPSWLKNLWPLLRSSNVPWRRDKYWVQRGTGLRFRSACLRFTAYRPPGPSLEILPVLTEYLRHLGDKPWCLGGDFNLNPHTGALPDALFGLGARVVAASGHLTSRTPTDFLCGLLAASPPATPL